MTRCLLETSIQQFLLQCYCMRILHRRQNDPLESKISSDRVWMCACAGISILYVQVYVKEQLFKPSDLNKISLHGVWQRLKPKPHNFFCYAKRVGCKVCKISFFGMHDKLCNTLADKNIVSFTSYFAKRSLSPGLWIRLPFRQAVWGRWLSPYMCLVTTYIHTILENHHCASVSRQFKCYVPWKADMLMCYETSGTPVVEGTHLMKWQPTCGSSTGFTLFAISLLNG